MTGPDIQALRNALGESQSQFAARLGLSQGRFSQIERAGVTRGPVLILLNQLRDEIDGQRTEQPSGNAA